MENPVEIYIFFRDLTINWQSKAGKKSLKLEIWSLSDGLRKTTGIY